MILIDACYRRKTPRPPLWFLCQAGQYLPEFKGVYHDHDGISLSTNPQLMAQISLQPVQRFDLDAATVFSDSLLVLSHMGVDLESHGPDPSLHVVSPIDEPTIVDFLKPLDAERDLGYLGEAMRLILEQLPPDKALIAGSVSPFGLACHALQGEFLGRSDPSRRFMFSHPDAFERLMDKITTSVIQFLRYQAKCGAHALMITDLWSGTLSAYDFQRGPLTSLRRVLDQTADLGIPRILFIRHASHLRWFLTEARVEVIGLDWTMPIAHSRRLLGPELAIQGNLDPMVLFAPHDYIVARTRAMLEANGGKAGYIASLGCNVHPDTPVENVQVFVDTIKAYR